MNENKLIWVLQSRKMWATLIGIILMIVTAIINKQAIDPDTLVNGIMVLVGIYVSAVAVEDGMSSRANANATTTTVTTPGTSDVKVSQPAEPVAPRVGPDGLR